MSEELEKYTMNFKCCRNVEFGSYDNTLALPRPVKMYPSEKGDWITVDKCIVEEVIELWKLGIWTLESCCGHCKEEGYIAVIDEDKDKMLKLGYKPSEKAPHVFKAKTQCNFREEELKSCPIEDALRTENARLRALTEWKEITEPLEWGRYLVTNNINARNNKGDMSHVWLTNMIHLDKEQKCFTCFYGLNDAKVSGLTHFIKLDFITPQIEEK